MSQPLAQRGRGMQSGQSLHSAIFGNFEQEFGKKATGTSARYLLSVYLQRPSFL